MISELSMLKWSISLGFKRSVFLTVVGGALLATYPPGLCAQDAGSSTPQTDTGSSTAQTAQQAAGTLTGDQQSAANKTLCSAIGILPLLRCRI